MVDIKTIHSCKKCGCLLFDRPTADYGRCPQCGYKLYPDGYHSEAVSDGYYDGFMGKIYPAPSWPEDRK